MNNKENKSHTKEDWDRVLESSEISKEYRRRIEIALEDGSTAAIRALGSPTATMFHEEKRDV